MRDPQVLEAVKQSLALLVERSPGRAIEVRIPPYACLLYTSDAADDPYRV
jgi:hypothetical protein